MSWRIKLSTAMLSACAFGNVASAASLLHPLFGDHAVLQRERPINVWGEAKAGEKVEVTLGNVRAQATADSHGAWSVTLPAMSAGGPYTLSATASSGTRKDVRYVLVGDVWLCSGQSNMVIPVNRALDARSEIANASSETVRLLTIPNASHAVPQPHFAQPIAWQTVNSTTIADFSAACWFFARELQKTVDVPMGLIAAAWGGAKIESWMSADALRAQGNFNEPLEILNQSVTDPWRALARWGAVWESWWRSRVKDQHAAPWSVKPSGEWRKAPAGLGPWEEWGDPRLSAYNGVVWYRTFVVLDERQAAQAAMLSLGQVDEVDQTWVNGGAIGARAANNLKPEERAEPVIGAGPNRTYRLPRGALVAGDNVIVVNVLDTYASGGLRGPASGRFLQLADGTRIPLDNEWSYQLPPVDIGEPLRAPWESVAGLGVIHNHMIAPLARFGIRGAAWYQGESNTEAANEYGSLLDALMADWRRKFGARLPFLIVQLANYGAAPTQPTASGWAELREQQRLAVARDANARLIVTIDIGERNDIHPANKQEVGRRLARAARNLVFASNEPPSGPRVTSAKAHDTRVIVDFADVTGRLVTYSATRPIGFELCAREQASCRFVDAEIEGQRVSLDRRAVPDATRVRFCWADSPVCTLYDEAQLPAGPFEVEITQ